MIKAGTKCRVLADSMNYFKPGDIVRIKIGAKSYDGIAMSNWVYTKRFYVESVSKDRILLNKSPDDSVFAINTPFNKADLINC